MRIALTGVNGRIGRVARECLLALGHQVQATDRTGAEPAHHSAATYAAGDLTDPALVDRVLAGAQVLVHMAATSNEQAFPLILENNHRALFEVYEGARRHGLRRIVYASSNHAFGLHPTDARLGLGAEYRADCFYGLSKVWGEALGRMYWQKHGIETVALRIGTFMDCPPRNARELATWLGREDLAELIRCAVEAASVGFAPVWGVSANSRAYYDLTEANAIGYVPRQSADAWSAQVLAQPEVGDTVAERFQGGRFVSQDYTAEELRPGPLSG